MSEELLPEEMSTAWVVAERLLEIGAVQVRPQEPFVWASGWKSPIYCDNRLSLSFPEVRSYIREQLAAEISIQYPEAEAVAGVATAGIPQAALVADALELPMLYVRSKPKDHGRENLIEGRIVPGQKVVVVEDLISTGGSSLQAALALREAGVEVIGLIAVFSYGFEVAAKQFGQAGIAFGSLSDYDTLLQVALRQQKFAPHQLPVLQAWRKDPANWGK